MKDKEYMSLNNKLKEILNNDFFVNNFKDAIDFRTKEFYKIRYDKKMV